MNEQETINEPRTYGCCEICGNLLDDQGRCENCGARHVIKSKVWDE